MNKILLIGAACIGLAACAGDKEPVFNTPPYTGPQTPVQIDDATGCPVGMPKYKCDQIHQTNGDPVAPATPS